MNKEDLISNFDLHKPEKLQSVFERFSNVRTSYYDYVAFSLGHTPCETFEQWKRRQKIEHHQYMIKWYRENRLSTNPTRQVTVKIREKNYELDRKIKECIRIAGKDKLYEIFGEDYWNEPMQNL